MSKKTLSCLFDEEPWQWGLRGDPFLWKEMAILLGEVPIPEHEAQLLNLLENAFQTLVGYSINHDAHIYIDRYSHGGMSSGYISPEFWRDTGFPLILSRYKL